MANKSRLIAGGAALALALSFVGVWEGLSLTAYRDTGGVPTICYGSTRAVKMGDRMTRADCDIRFTVDLVEHEFAMRKCLRAPDVLTDKTYVAFLSFTYNVGGGAACKSTAFRLINAGQIGAACDQLPRWVRDNGRVIGGLVSRRVSERALCREGLG